ncbi:MAG: SOS response-associated peptidase [Thermoanaerobaculales bacterium]|nr:SOS response-associated peptidase [Thermoanaerobaculales bacterium]
MSHSRRYGERVCGRYVIAQDVDAYARFFGVDEIRTEMLAANYNVAPTDSVYAVADHEESRLLGTFRWGLIPFWAKSPSGGQINARAESVAEKAIFRDSFARRRCLIPADGFYEWQQMERGKLPHYIYLRDGSPMAFAGLWSTWRDQETGERIRSCAIITTNAHPALAAIHGRMPVMLEPAVWDAWLNRSLTDPDQARALLKPLPETAITEHPVSTLVNNVHNNLTECIAPLPDRSP